MEITWNQFVISDNKERLDVDVIKGFLARSYWANKRPEERTLRSIENSECYGVYEGRKQVGYARVITDHATMFYLCDVFIDEDYRGMGIGKKLVESLVTSDEYKDLMGLLGTKDAHELYEQYNFEHDAERCMRRMPDYVRNMKH
ncbi:GNAT family N-acetyltransferase [Paenibacillus qinlingensis]|uniref:GNAT superfamily N-acetyltransferase n=1 Tax=Paenibacillus qinlingensis TaxID=1837343 RepID=A0ABU1P1T1_9BACL|nr:GNAT family N-acetyltransferase [Paenibacillus qinlingensis]MDR6553489.1 GNAT superfamily N-acetyltransferase [Paenibacillus qinlingensis]